MYRPGAESSGFMKPSIVEPHADHGATVSSFVSGFDAEVGGADRDHERDRRPGLYRTPLGEPSVP